MENRRATSAKIMLTGILSQIKQRETKCRQLSAGSPNQMLPMPMSNTAKHTVADSVQPQWQITIVNHGRVRWPNVPAHRPRASDAQIATKTQSRGSVQPVC